MKKCEYCQNVESDGHADWCPDKDHPQAAFTVEVCDFCEEEDGECADWCPENKNEE